MEEELTKEVLIKGGLERIDALAAKLGMVTEHLWGVLVRAQPIEAINTLVFFALFLALLTACAKYKWFGPFVDEKDNPIGTNIAIGVGLGFLVLVWGGVQFFALTSVAQKLFNPEYAALDYLVTLAKWK